MIPGFANSKTEQPTTVHCRCALITPPGRSALATIAVWGRLALSAVASAFRPARGGSFADAHAGDLCFGHWQTSDGNTEGLVVSVINAEKLEIHCHGGAAAPRRIMRSLVAAGCETANNDQWVRTEFRERTQAEAYSAVAAATTERTAAILLDQMRGALATAVAQIRQQLDRGESLQAARDVAQLRARYELGRHLVAPWYVVIAGPPNAGKSSLVNTMLGYQRAVVYHQPGTTRDVLSAQTAIDGWPVELVDTAGLGDLAADSVEQHGMRKTLEQATSADLIIWVNDLTAAPAMPGSLAVPETCPILPVFNKADLTDARPANGAAVVTSAVTGFGTAELLAAVARQLVPVPPAPAMAVPFLPRHAEVLDTTADALRNNHVELAREALRQMSS